MTCAKKYGPGAILVNRETSFGQGVGIGHRLAAQSASFGALNREVIDNTELRSNRGTSESFKGAQSEISWEISIALTFASGDDYGIGDLWWAAGRDENNLANGSICGRSLQLTRFDRDGLLCEILNGCLVQNVTYSFSATDLCTITFSGVAASKIELSGVFSGANIAWPSTGSSLAITGHVNSSFKMLGLPPNTCPQDIYALCYDADGEYIDQVPISDITNNAYVFTVDAQTTPPTVDKILLVTEETEAERFPTFGPADWIIEYQEATNWIALAAQSVEISLETGLSFGELTTTNALPSEIISGKNACTGSFTVYLDDSAEKLLKFTNTGLKIKPRNPNNNYGLLLNNVMLNTKPAFELAPDAAASGDFEFTAWSSETDNYDLQWF